jgi:tRNA(Phe) wybutosine-synthesizing methylase Tyw3
MERPILKHLKSYVRVTQNSCIGRIILILHESIYKLNFRMLSSSSSPVD